MNYFPHRHTIPVYFPHLQRTLYFDPHPHKKFSCPHPILAIHVVIDHDILL